MYFVSLSLQCAILAHLCAETKSHVSQKNVNVLTSDCLT